MRTLLLSPWYFLVLFCFLICFPTALVVKTLAATYRGCDDLVDQFFLYVNFEVSDVSDSIL